MPPADPIPTEASTTTFLNNMLGADHAGPIEAKLIEEGVFTRAEAAVLFAAAPEEEAAREGGVLLHGKSNGDMIREVWERFQPVAILTLDTKMQHEWYRGKQYDPPPCPVIRLSWNQSAPDRLEQIAAKASAAVRFAKKDTTKPWFYVQSRANRDEITPETQPRHVLEYHERRAAEARRAGTEIDERLPPPAPPLPNDLPPLLARLPDQPGILERFRTHERGAGPARSFER